MVKNKWVPVLTAVLSLVLLVSAVFAFDSGLIGAAKRNLKEGSKQGSYQSVDDGTEMKQDLKASDSRGEYPGTKDAESVKQNLGNGSNQGEYHEAGDTKSAGQSLKEEGLKGDSNQGAAYENIISPVEVFDKYMAKYPGTKVKEVELKSKGDYYVYEIEGYDKNNRYELKIHSTSGKILKEEVEKNKGSYGKITGKHLEKVPDLVTSALKDAGKGATLHEWEVEFDDGRPELEIEIKIKKQNKKIEYEYNLETGKLIEKEVKKIK